MSIAAALRDAAERLSPVSDTPRLDAECLMAHALGVSRSQLWLEQDRLAVPDSFAALVERRMAREPVAYITGHQGFWDLDLVVTPAVLIPRPDSETLIEAAAELLRARPPARILDLGTGSGALVLAALSLFPDAMGVGIDASAAALAVASENARRTGLSARCRLVHADWRQPGWAGALGGPFDLVLANPPYVEEDADLAPNVAAYEPASALYAGADGMDDYRILVPQMGALLAPQGLAIFEIGKDQGDAVMALAKDAGMAATVRRDLAGHPRAVLMQRAGEDPLF